MDWRDCIEQLARDFLAGRADVNPREYPKTCDRCGLQTLCRIQEPENQAQLETPDDPDLAESIVLSSDSPDFSGVADE
jgi:hypothetical protein